MSDAKPRLTIDGREIGSDREPYLVAELSANHDGDRDAALALIDAAAAAGADAIKIQTYRPDTITLDCDGPGFRIENGLWAGRTLYDLYAEAHTPWEWHEAMFARARERAVTLFSAPFDPSAVEFLDELGAPAFKIASFEIVDLPLIRAAASKKKPLVISTGMASLSEIEEAVAAARAAGCEQLALLRCVSGYPAPAEDYGLRALSELARRFGVCVGLSDHTLEDVTAIASIALGGCMIEKHFTLDRSRGGPDDSFSLEPDEFARLARNAATAWRSLGEPNFGPKASETANRAFRRSLYVVRDVRAGDAIGPADVRSIRPGHGLAPKHLDAVIGMKAARDLAMGEPAQWSCFEPVSQADRPREPSTSHRKIA